MAHQAAVDAVNKTPYSRDGRGKFQGKGKAGGYGKGKGKGKGAYNKTKEGGVSKPKKGGCHRCGGAHLVRSCPKPVVE